MTDFAKQMHREAENLASLMEKESRRCRSVPNWNTIATASDGSVCTNVKPFYSPYANFDPEMCNVVFVGDNPGGNPKLPDKTTGTQYRESLGGARGSYNAFLHEAWGHWPIGCAPMQDAVQKVFGVLFRQNRWRQQLLHSASFNVCPLRTSKTHHIPCQVWTQSELWCNGILDHLRPDLIICCGYSDDYDGELARSPWAMLKRRQGFEVLHRASWKQQKIRLKYGKFNEGTLAGTTVIGLRHLSNPKYAPITINLLKQYRNKLDLQEYG